MHLITRVKVGSEEVWLDPTTEVAPYKVLLFVLRDKEALVVPEEGVASLERTPKDLPFAATDNWKVVSTLDKEGTTEAHIVLNLRGDDEVQFRAAVHQVSPGQYDELSQRIVASMGYGGTVSLAAFGRPEDTAEPFTTTFDYHREKPATIGKIFAPYLNCCQCDCPCSTRKIRLYRPSRSAHHTPN